MSLTLIITLMILAMILIKFVQIVTIIQSMNDKQDEDNLK